MHILGLCNGSLHGNSEILLKAALVAAQASRPDTTISWLHVPSVITPRNAAPLPNSLDISLGQNASLRKGNPSDPSIINADDRAAVRDALLGADAIIVASATYSHAPAGSLKVLMDAVGGPYLDVGFATRALEQQAAGDARYADLAVDPRLLKPRVVGFMLTGGCQTADQFSLALPGLHGCFFYMHAKVVDQWIGKGLANPAAALIDATVLERVRRLGRNVAAQMGKRYEEAEYLGERVEGGCPNCHLRTVEFLSGVEEGVEVNAVGCMTCGTRGHLVLRPDGKIVPEWEEDSIWSCQTMRGKIKHAEDVYAFGSAEKPKLEGVEDEKKRWIEMDIPKVPLPSDGL